MAEASCPMCGAAMRFQSWQDDVWGAIMTVETHYECECGYECGWTYGQDHEEFCGMDLPEVDDEWGWKLVDILCEQRNGVRLAELMEG